eukprot:gene6879-8213_t
MNYVENAESEEEEEQPRFTRTRASKKSLEDNIPRKTIAAEKVSDSEEETAPADEVKEDTPGKAVGGRRVTRSRARGAAYVEVKSEVDEEDQEEDQDDEESAEVSSEEDEASVHDLVLKKLNMTSTDDCPFSHFELSAKTRRQQSTLNFDAAAQNQAALSDSNNSSDSNSSGVDEDRTLKKVPNKRIAANKKIKVERTPERRSKRALAPRGSMLDPVDNFSEDSDEDDQETGAESGDEDEEAEEGEDDEEKLEKILAARRCPETGEQQFLVKWIDLSYRQTTWESCKRITQKSAAMVRNFVKKFGVEKETEPDLSEMNLELFQKVSRVIAEQGSGEDRQYLVKWHGLGYAQSTWELADHLTSSEDQEAVAKFKRVLSPASRCVQAAKDTSVPSFNNGRSLREYQEASFSWMVSNFRQGISCVLADEMGLGKTAQSVAVLEKIRLTQRTSMPFLIVAPLVTLEHWRREIECWTDMNVVLFAGGAADRALCLEYDFFHGKSKAGRVKFNVLLTSFELARSEGPMLEKIKFQAIVVDEAHRLKDLNSQTTMSITALDYKWALLLTGTPIQNNVKELFSLLHVLDAETWHSWEEFSAKYCGGGEKPKGAEEVAMIKEMLKPRLLRRLKEEVETLPTKEEVIVWVELTKEQKSYYRAVYERKIHIMLQGNKPSNVPSLRNVAMELRKVCNHPFLCSGLEEDFTAKRAAAAGGRDGLDTTQMYVDSSGKMVLLDKLLPKLKEGGHKVLIFSQFTMMLDMLEPFFEGRGYAYERLDGSTGQLERQQAIDRFNGADDSFIFMLSTKAGGVGITLTAADTAIIFDSDWNPQNDLQAMARCHRIGQKRDVRVYRLITRHTYEQGLFESASRKCGLDEAILGVGNDDCAADPKMEKQKIDDLLKYGAHALMCNKEGEMDTGDAFGAQDIEQILAQRTETREVGGNKSGNSFSVATFTVSDEAEAAEEGFWEGFYGAEACAQAKAAGDPDVVMSQPRQRKRVVSYQEEQQQKRRASDGDSDFESADEEEGDDDEMEVDAGRQWTETDLQKVEDALLSLGDHDLEQVRHLADLKHPDDDVDAVIKCIIATYHKVAATLKPVPDGAAGDGKGGTLEGITAPGKIAPSAPAAALGDGGEGAPAGGQQAGEDGASTKVEPSTATGVAERAEEEREGAEAAQVAKPMEVEMPAEAQGSGGAPIPARAQRALQGDKWLEKLRSGRENAAARLARLKSRAALWAHVHGDLTEAAAQRAWTVPVTKSHPPAEWWGEAEDRALLLGSLKYGFNTNSFKELGRQLERIRTDPELVFSQYAWAAATPKTDGKSASAAVEEGDPPTRAPEDSSQPAPSNCNGDVVVRAQGESVDEGTGPSPAELGVAQSCSPAPGKARAQREWPKAVALKKRISKLVDVLLSPPKEKPAPRSRAARPPSGPSSKAARPEWKGGGKSKDSEVLAQADKENCSNGAEPFKQAKKVPGARSIFSSDTPNVKRPLQELPSNDLEMREAGEQPLVHREARMDEGSSPVSPSDVPSTEQSLPGADGRPLKGGPGAAATADGRSEGAHEEPPAAKEAAER